MKDHLVVHQAGDGYFYIAWYLAEEQDFGAYVGEGPLGTKEPDRLSERDEWECWTADKIAREDPDHIDEDMGYCWETAAAAKRVLAQINLAFKAPRPLHDWEKKALEAGWKPPKGWEKK